MKQVTESKYEEPTSIGGTSLKGHIECSYDSLVHEFGNPQGGTDKTDAEWAIEFPCGTVATIYNWKNGENYCGGQGTPLEHITQWNIGGYQHTSVELVKKALDK